MDKEEITVSKGFDLADLADFAFTLLFVRRDTPAYRLFRSRSICVPPRDIQPGDRLCGCDPDVGRLRPPRVRQY